MIPLSTAALVTARKPGFSALLFSDVKAPSGNPDEFKQAAAEDALFPASEAEGNIVSITRRGRHEGTAQERRWRFVSSV